MRTVEIQPDERYSELEAMVDRIPNAVSRADAKRLIRTLADTDRRRKVLNKHIIDALETLRLEVQSLIFDRDCLRNELEQLKNQGH